MYRYDSATIINERVINDDLLAAVSQMGQLTGLVSQQSLLINQLLAEIKTGKQEESSSAQEPS